MSWTQTPLGALPLFFEERPDRRGPLDRLHLPIVHDDTFDDDPAELLPSRRGSHRNCFGQPEDPHPVDIERADPIVPNPRLSSGKSRAAGRFPRDDPRFVLVGSLAVADPAGENRGSAAVGRGDLQRHERPTLLRVLG
jgi:hypothetical protein